MFLVQGLLFLLSILASSVWGGQELLHNFELAPDDLRPHDIAIIQFETRNLNKRYKSKAKWYDNNYWNVSARWNKVLNRYLLLFTDHLQRIRSRPMHCGTDTSSAISRCIRRKDVERRIMTFPMYGAK